MDVRTGNTNRTTAKEGWLLLTGAALILLFFFFKLFNTLSPQLEKADTALLQGRALKLEGVINKDVLKKIISDGSYYTDKRDVDLLADSLSSILLTEGTLSNLGSLNKSAYAITAPVAWKTTMGGVDLQDRLRASRQRLGFDSALYAQELNSPANIPAEIRVSTGEAEMKGRVLLQGKPMNGVLVQLRQHLPFEELAEELENDSVTDVIAYARTNNNGEFSFSGLVRDSGYSVLPMKPGFEFGTRQGSSRLGKKASYTFAAKPHKIRLIGSIVYGQLKEDGVLMVRTPEEFKTSYQIIAGGLIGAFLFVHLLLSFRKKRPDIFLLPALLLLCGISVLMLLSIQDPLMDTLYAFQALQGAIAGLVGYVILCSINISRLYTRWWFDWLFNFKQKNIYQQKGWTWLALAILMAVVTYFIGTGPEGSGVKVNIQLGGLTFQPGEITKYLLLFFLAGFFAATADNIRNLSDIRWRFYINWGVFAGIGIILALYLLMGDMGPAMVVCFTFLFFYSIARSNLLLTVIAGVTYCVLLWLVPGWMATVIAFCFVVIVLLTQGHLRSIKWYGAFAVIADAPVIVLMVIAAFAFGDRIPGIGDRLAERKAMWLSQWNNDVFGGDHLAHSYWTLSSGGLSGQGIGRGFPNTMPAAHTDMILPSIGEEFGWVGLVAVFLLFGIIIHRTFLHARRSGQPFTFYLCAGIAIALGVQLLLIAGGSIGLLPLTGVAVPFLSYGKISLIINLAAMGIVAGISARPGHEVQQEYVQKNYDPVLSTGISFFLIGIAVLAGKLFFVQVADRKEYLVKQARVVMRNGLPIYSYNPRIDKLMRLLAAGNIYDRKGLILATSEASIIQQNLDSLQHAGLNRLQLQELSQKHVRRFYPFEEQLFFWTGDYNTRLFWGQANGYFAEARYLTSLRGFGVSREIQDSVHTLYQPDRFTKPFYKTIQMSRYDYSSLVDGLAAGIDSNQLAIRKIRDMDRTVHLSVDAALQVELQDSLHNSTFKNKRISVVVLDAVTGDVLASALNPLPNLQSPELMMLTDRERNQLEIPVTDRDLGMTYSTAPGSTVKILTAMAGLNKLGMAAAEVKYKDIYRSEIFRDNKREQEPFVPKVPFVDMHEAIVNSSNIFFIRLANDNYLEDEMASLYEATGMSVNQRGGYNYTLLHDRKKQSEDLAAWRKDVLNGDHRQYNNPGYAGKTKRYRSLFSGLAWGQSVLTATPASMARMAGAIANKGILQPSRYCLLEAGQSQPLREGVKISNDTSYASLLEHYMIDQSSTPGRQKIHTTRVAGKTGTPERIVKGEKQSDGWYVFFAPTPDSTSHTVTCIRIEVGQSSANAVIIANTVANILQRRAYISSF
jgi:cell division protein FtsW (lipid II flippase)/cell division protein FtsI/penicillin-binding protein 2